MEGILESWDITAAKLKNTTGYSLDIGGSLIKIAWLQRDTDNTLKMKLKSFPRELYDEAIVFIKQITKSSPPEAGTIFTCGLGCHQWKDELEETLQIQLKNVSETKCCVQALIFMTEMLELDDIVQGPSKAAYDIGRAWAKEQASIMSMFQQRHCDDEEPSPKPTEINDYWDTSYPVAGKDGISQEENRESNYLLSSDTLLPSCASPPTKSLFPCLLYIVGSGTLALKVYEDGTVDVINVIPIAGKTFTGLGSLVTDGKSYPELICMAEEGDANKVHSTGAKLVRQDRSDVYSNLGGTTRVVFCLGNVLESTADYTENDLVAGILSLVARELGHVFHLHAVLYGIQNIVIAGGFTRHQVVRDEISKLLSAKNLYNVWNKSPRHWYLKHGGYLGAIGALLKSVT